MKEILEDLAKLADSLDKNASYKLADEVDLIIRKYSSQKTTAFEGFKNLSLDGVGQEIPISEEDFNVAQMANKIMSAAEDQEKD
jgi:hypothetical protein